MWKGLEDLPAPWKLGQAVVQRKGKVSCDFGCVVVVF